MIKHCIVDTNINKVVNIIEYETVQTGIPKGFELTHPNWLCIATNIGGIDWDYVNGSFVDNRPQPANKETQ